MDNTLIARISGKEKEERYMLPNFHLTSRNVEALAILILTRIPELETQLRFPIHLSLNWSY